MMRWSQLFIGNKEIEMDNDNITNNGNEYKVTKALWELITLKEPSNYYIQIYKTIKTLQSL